MTLIAADFLSFNSNCRKVSFYSYDNQRPLLIKCYRITQIEESRTYKLIPSTSVKLLRKWISQGNAQWEGEIHKGVAVVVLIGFSANSICIGHCSHYGDVIMGTMASQITSLMIVYPTVYSDIDQRKHPNSASLDFVRGIHRSPVNSRHKGPVTRIFFQLMTSSCNCDIWMYYDVRVADGVTGFV